MKIKNIDGAQKIKHQHSDRSQLKERIQRYGKVSLETVVAKRLSKVNFN